jgi:hypothetical protein
VGAAASVILYVRQPSFPTPDKLLVFLTFVFMAFGQGWEFFKRLAPFVAMLLVYESFRGLAHLLNSNVNYTFMIDADRLLGLGALPTQTLQAWLWQGHVQWYDFYIYLVYMLHFVLPVALALVVWKYRPKAYWQYITAFISLSFAGFLTFLAFPAAPPWMASQQRFIPEVTRVSSHVWAALGIHDFPSLYNKISPNPVAAMPSLHAAYATLFALFVYKLFGKKPALFASIYPLTIYFGTVYQGEHYLIDAIVGALYAGGAFVCAPVLLRKLQHLWQVMLLEEWIVVHTAEELALQRAYATIDDINN